MTYCISDIHGCYAEYLKALELIKFNDDDTLYVLGDCVDRGPEPMELLLDMMSRPNVIPLCGNHDFVAASMLRTLNREITEDNYDKLITEEFLEDLAAWIEEGGETTLNGFKKLSKEQRTDILEYFMDFTFYEEVKVNGKQFVMVHGGLEPFNPDYELDDYSPDEIMFSRADLNRVYLEDKFTVTGHTPTPGVPGNNGTIIKQNNHIAIDCGCISGYNLAVYCLDTGEEFYVSSLQKKSE